MTDVTFSLEEGEILVIVGESGSGKTTVIRALIGLLSVGGHVVAGGANYRGQDIATWSEEEWRKYRGTDISMIFQDSGSAMDPIQTIGKQFIAHIRRHSDLDKGAAETKAIELMKMVSLPADKDFLKRYPFELSGGQRQRLGIAMAMAFTPHLLLADEPTSALDVSVQDSIAKLLVKLQKEKNLTYLFVAHDIALIRSICHRVVVMYNGEVVEAISAKHLTEAKHPYTRKLLAAVFEVTEHRKPVVL